METLAKLILENPYAVMAAGVPVPCALEDLLRLALEDFALLDTTPRFAPRLDLSGEANREWRLGL